ncbi:Cotton fiber expressed protein [Carex littledalei]|uniref:Cotton fiber expressed protein n=1 Tax=Carex littledalei TaxID=544730 RepID=A0A833QGC0_9POAL|nr:Cotton fiber expressed protein [Carex littledalei]
MNFFNKKRQIDQQSRRLLQLRFLETLELWHSRQSPRLHSSGSSLLRNTKLQIQDTFSLFPSLHYAFVDHDFDRDEADLLFYQREKEHEQIEYDGREAEFMELIEEGDQRLEEKGIDTKAEEFISGFYEEMKLQRQVSAIQYYEMLERSA